MLLGTLSNASLFTSGNSSSLIFSPIDWFSHGHEVVPISVTASFLNYPDTYIGSQVRN